jgi:protein-disulfide isomerase-like protein with CxxC motif
MKHIFSVVGLGMTAVFVAVFFTGRMNSRQLDLVAPRVGMQPEALSAMAPRVSSQTGATIGTSRRVVYLLACSGVPTAATIESKAIEAALITEKQRMTAREAASKVLSGTPAETETSPLRDC